MIHSRRPSEPEPTKWRRKVFYDRSIRNEHRQAVRAGAFIASFVCFKRAVVTLKKPVS